MIAANGTQPGTSVSETSQLVLSGAGVYSQTQQIISAMPVYGQFMLLLPDNESGWLFVAPAAPNRKGDASQEQNG